MRLLKLSGPSFVVCALIALCMESAQGAEKSWEALLAAAQKEGKVVVLGPPDSEVRINLPRAFKKRFGITLEYLGGRGSSHSAKIRTERSAGVYTADVAVAGLSNISRVYYRGKMLDPIRPALVLPDVLDGSKWRAGKLWFADPKNEYILRISNNVQRSLYINVDSVKPSEIRSAHDLLDPRWKGKIAMDDPRISGSGLTMAARFLKAFGEDFVRKLYIGQKPKLTRGRRQLTDWLLRGTYPLVFGADDGKVTQARKEGFNVQALNLPDLPESVSAGYGMMAMFNRAPHPNAAKVFVNWLASKEGMEIYSRARGEVPTRADIDAASYLPKSTIPQPEVKYVDTYSWDFTTKFRSKTRRFMKKLLGPAPKRKRNRK